MKFNLNDFLELDTNGLFAVNGGTDSHSSSYSPSSTTSEGGSGGPGFGICQYSRFSLRLSDLFKGKISNLSAKYN